MVLFSILLLFYLKKTNNQIRFKFVAFTQTKLTDKQKFLILPVKFE